MTIQVLKSDFKVIKSNSGVFAIVNKNNFLEVVFGGDSANEDDYNEEYINEVYNLWNGELNCDSKYGHKISI